MWKSRSRHEDPRKEVGGEKGLVAVAINKDKNSQCALKWAVEHLLHMGENVVLIHVKLKDSEAPAEDIFIPYRCFCKRKNIQCKVVLLEEPDVAKALVECAYEAAIGVLLVGTSCKGGFLRFQKHNDIPGQVVKYAPDFCTVYVISKGKIVTMRSASTSPPTICPIRTELQQSSLKVRQVSPSPANSFRENDNPRNEAQSKSVYEPSDSFRSPFGRRGVNGRSFAEISVPDSDLSIVISSRSSVDRSISSSFYNNAHLGHNPSRVSSSFDIDDHMSFDSTPYGQRSVDIVNSQPDFSIFSAETDRLSPACHAVDDVDAEMRRLKLELKQTIEMYSSACKEALCAKQKATELQLWKQEEERRMVEEKMAEEYVFAIAEREKIKSKAAIEAAEAAQRIAKLEAQKRINAEMEALKDAEEKFGSVTAVVRSTARYRKYSIDDIEIATEFFAEKRKVGEGGYGPVYKCNLDHTPVAVKVLRPDAAQGRSQFQQEVEVLCSMRHPNMVLLLGACPEYGCLVYEFMANGSLEDRLFRRGNTRPLSWQARFRIAAEIATALLFLHQAKPEPLVHRDLKPANILLDRNFVSKISDVGLARLVPPTVTDTVTQYRMTATAGTFCYIDPEYQQTGMLGVKSDIYSLGIMFLQILTAKPPMGLTHHVGRAIMKGTFAEFLDPAVPDWPVEEALELANMSLKCSELRRKDRPDLSKAVLPLLNRLRTLAEESFQPVVINSPGPTPPGPTPDTSPVSSDWNI